MPRPWTCRSCKYKNPSKRTMLCAKCGKRRPKTRKPAHMAALDIPYEDYIILNGGEHCGICGKGPSGRRRLDRDHCHTTGRPRGLLCPRHNRGLRYFDDDPVLMENAAKYLRRLGGTGPAEE